jgi:hypothetical protein
MSENPSKCLLCGGTVHEGFIVDRADAFVQSAQWAAGPPQQRAFFAGIKSPKNPHGIRAYRCESCGFLMQFAIEPEKPKYRNISD